MQMKHNIVTRYKHDAEFIARDLHDPCVVARGNPLNCRYYDFFSFALTWMVIG